jgi:hypothetical protein
VDHVLSSTLDPDEIFPVSLSFPDGCIFVPSILLLLRWAIQGNSDGPPLHPISSLPYLLLAVFIFGGKFVDAILAIPSPPHKFLNPNRVSSPQ